MVFLDYNAKFDRRDPPLSLELSEIRGLVSSHVRAEDIQSVSHLASGFINWKEIARLLDLAAMVNFLDNEREAPKTFGMAISVIRRTLESLEGELGAKRNHE